MYRQPDTGAPVSDPLLKTGASQPTAPLGPFAQPLSNRTEPGRPEAAPSPTSAPDRAEPPAAKSPPGPLRLAAEATSADVTPPQSQPPWAPPIIVNATASEEGEKLTKLEKRKQDRHGVHGERDPEEEPRLRNETPEPIGTPRKGTHFFGGAGMDRAYIGDFVTAFKEAGVEHARAVDSEIWSTNGPIDALSVALEMDRDFELTGNADFGEEGEQFNLVGFSYGGTQAAQAAADYADRGGKVDHLVLIGTPISQRFLDALENHPNIGTVIVKDLPGDPVHAGMDFWELPGAAATFLGQERRGETGVDGVPGHGHFHYSGDDPESARRRREFVKKLVEAGFK